MKILSQNFKIIMYTVWMVLAFISCDEFVEAGQPTNEITTEIVYQDNTTAISAMMGVYSELSNSSGFVDGSSGSIYVLSGLSSDEFIPVSTDLTMAEFYNNSLLPQNTMVFGSLWQPIYNTIYKVNLVLEGLGTSNGLTIDIKKQLEGEARFIRAFCYYHLVNLFGEVPLILDTDFESNRLAVKTGSNEIYQQIVADLRQAGNLLPDGHDDYEDERLRPNKWVAKALLSRVYLFMEQWQHAEEEASSVLSQSHLYQLQTDLNSVFLANSREALWQIKPVRRANTEEAAIYVPTRSNGSPLVVALSDELVQSLEENDQRKVHWIGTVTNTLGQEYYYPFKYKNTNAQGTTTEYSMVIRLAELYLIRSEARLKLGDLNGTLADLNIIRNRSGLQDYPMGTSEALYKAIIEEKQLELFSEGHRWFDLKRSKTVDETLQSLKPDWQPTDSWYPIPQSELESNPNLTQNQGY